MDPRRGHGLAIEAGHELRLVAVLVAQHLEREAPARDGRLPRSRRVAELGQVHLPGAAAAEELDHAVATTHDHPHERGCGAWDDRMGREP